MPLDPATYETFIAWLNSRAKDLKCVACGQNNWNVGDLSSVPVFKNAVTDFGRVMPIVPLVCTTCGHVLFFSAITSGVYPPSTPGPEAQPPPGEEKEEGRA